MFACRSNDFEPVRQDVTAKGLAPSCRRCGCTPSARYFKLQVNTASRSSNVCEVQCLCSITANGIRVAPWSPTAPGKLKANVSTDCVLSQLHGVPSIQRPKGTMGGPSHKSALAMWFLDGSVKPSIEHIASMLLSWPIH